MKNKAKFQAIIYIIFAGLGFSLMSVFVRLSGDLPVMEKAFFRNLVALFVALFMVKKEKIHISIPKESRFWLLLRCSFGFLGIVCNFYAVDHMNIADANMLNKLSPFFAIIASVFILGEMANWIEWSTVVIAFLGALFIIKPSFQIEFVVGLIGIFGGFSAGTAYTCLRKCSFLGMNGRIIVMCFSAFSSALCIPFMAASYVPMKWWQLGCLVMAGLSAAVGQFSITKAYSKAAAKEISIFDYSQILFAALWGVIFFGQIPDLYSVIGYVIIIGVAIFRWQYNLKNS